MTFCLKKIMLQPTSFLSTKLFHTPLIKGLVSKETVVLRRKRSETQNLDLSTELIRYIGRCKEIES